MKNIVQRLRQQGKIVALTCYTGIACLQYKGLGAVTLHKFSGLEDGRHADADLYHLVQNDERFRKTRENIQKTNILIIDEVSMV